MDIGDVSIGVAISDPLEVIASGLETISRTDLKGDISAIKCLVENLEIEKIVVGLPKTMDGKIGRQAQKVLDFVESLRTAVDVPINLFDERLTTVSADKSLIEADVRREKRKKIVDKVSAILILQGYLNSSHK